MTETTIPSPPDTHLVAASLARFGMKVFPVRVTQKDDGKRGKYPLTGRGVDWSKVATDDPATILEWWQANPEAWPGIYTGGSGLVVGDVDLSDDPAKDGPTSLKAHGLKLPKTYKVKTLGGGQHRYFAAPEGVPATIARDVVVKGEKVRGIDVRAGGGYVVYYGKAWTALPDFEPAPSWLIVEKKVHEAKHDVDLAEWLEALSKGKASDRVARLIDRASAKNVGHDEMLDITKLFAQYVSEGARGTKKAYRLARAAYLRGFPDYAEAWDQALIGSIKVWGLPAHEFTIPKGTAVEVYADPAATAPKPEGLPEVVIRRAPRVDPEQFFDPKTGLQSAMLAEVIDRGDVAIGPDKAPWFYEDGVWRPDEGEFDARVVEALGDRTREAYFGLARRMILAKRDIHRLSNEPLSEYMNLENGMYHWRTGDLVPHDPGFFSIVRLPIRYDAAAECPAFDAWLDEVVGPDLVVVVWELIAYTMMSGNPFQMAALLLGPGGTGKGTLIRLLENMLGSANYSTVLPANMGARFETATMLGKLANVVGDLPGTYMPDSDAFKRVTGGDTISGEYKNGKLFGFKPWCFPIFGANKVARSGDTSSGFTRRWVVVPFTHKVKSGEPFDESVLHAEAAGIFRKAMTHLPRVIAQNDFTETVDTMLAKVEFTTASDALLSWLEDDEHVVTHDPSDREASVLRTHLYDRYSLWATGPGRAKPVARMTFIKRIRELGYREKKVGGLWHFVGLAVDSTPIGTHGVPYRPDWDVEGLDDLDP